jgi:hypothetical protein
MNILKTFNQVCLAIICVGFASTAAMAQTCGGVPCQDSLEIEKLKISVSKCQALVDKMEIGEASRKACLFASINPGIQYKSYLKDFGPQDGLTQYAAYLAFFTNLYVVESYIALSTLDDPLSWTQTMCKYQAEVDAFIDLPYDKLSANKKNWVESSKPRSKEISAHCQMIPTL